MHIFIAILLYASALFSVLYAGANMCAYVADPEQQESESWTRNLASTYGYAFLSIVLSTVAARLLF